mgnify:FL=1
MKMVNEQTLEKAIDQINGMINVMISDISLGASYTRANSTACLDMIQLVQELKLMKAPKPKVSKQKAK